MLAKIKIHLKKLSSWSLFFLILVVALIPIDHPNTKALHKLTHFFDNVSPKFPDFFSTTIYFFLADIALLGVICTAFRRMSFWHGSCKYLTIMCLLLLLSIVLSDMAAYPLQYVRLFHFFIACFIFYNLAIINNEKFIKILAFVLVNFAFLESAVGISQYFLQSSIGLKDLGEVQISSPVPIHDGTRWIVDLWLNFSLGHNFLIRAYGTLPYPTIYGAFLFFGLLTSYYLYIQADKKWRLIFVPLIFIQIFALCVTFSRSAQIAWFFATILWFVVMYVKFRTLKGLKSLSVLVLACAAISFSLLYPQFLDRGGIVNYNKSVKDVDSERVHYQKMAWQMIKEHPVFGIGYNNFLLQYDKYNMQGDLYNRGIVHNNYLLFGAEGGLLTMLVFLAFIFSLLISFYKATLTPLSLTFLSVFLGYLFISGCDLHPLTFQQGKVFFLSAGLLAASLNLRPFNVE